MTKREAILQAIHSRLTGLTGVDDDSVYRSAVEAFARRQLPAVVLEPQRDSAELSVVPFVDWSLVVRVTVMIRGDVPDSLADPIVESIHSKLAADTSLGGLAIDIQPLAVSFDLLEGDKPTGLVALDYRVTYRTAGESLA